MARKRTETTRSRKKNSRPPESIDWREAKRLYVEEGLKFSEVAQRIGHDARRIRRGLLAQGVRSRGRLQLTTGTWGKRLGGVWALMKKKCRDRTYSSYKHYGARGIDFCPEWERFECFYRWALESGYRPGRPLVLKERARVFSPATCYWAPARERAKLRLRLNPPSPKRLITAFGETKGLMAWVEDPRCEVTRGTVARRLARGYTAEDAIALPGNLGVPDGDRGIRRRPGRKRAKRKAKVIDWTKAERLCRQGMSPPRIARKLGVSYTGVLAGLKRKGLYVPRARGIRFAKVAAPLYGIWYRIREIGTRRNRYDHAYYGARGARVSREWSTFAPFYLWAIESGYRAGLRLVRRDRSSGFSPANCRWVTRKRAAQIADEPPPTPAARFAIRAFGETKSADAWSRDPRCAVNVSSLRQRLRSGMSPEQAITKSPRAGGSHPGTRYVRAFGVAKRVADWTRDRRCGVSRTTLVNRLQRGMKPEEAITRPPRKAHMGGVPGARPPRRARSGKRKPASMRRGTAPGRR